MVLKVDALRSGVGCDQDADGRDVGVGLEGGFHALALVRIHPAVEGEQPIATGQPLCGEQALEPVLRGPVLGEHDDSLARPPTIGAHDRVQGAEQLGGLGIRTTGSRRHPVPHPAQEIALVHGELRKQP
jgi:hypothetical protein